MRNTVTLKQNMHEKIESNPFSKQYLGSFGRYDQLTDSLDTLRLNSQYNNLGLNELCLETLARISIFFIKSKFKFSFFFIKNFY